MTLEFNQAVDSVISIDNVIENIDISITPESSSISSTPIDVTLSSSGELNIEIVVSNDPVPLRVDIDTYGPIYVDVNTNQTIDFSVELNTDINKGEKGDDGDTGPQGPRGERGEKGDKGDVGATGATGPAGSTGLDGAKGDKGDKGDLGLTGAKGDKGDQGNQGFKGDKGDTGPAGVKGDQGVQGIQGRDGLTTSVNGVTQIDGNVTLTKSDIDLGNVDDTSDLNKPISTATQSALDLKLGLNTPITAGSNSKITYDSNGLVLSSSKADISDITDLASVLSNKLETSLKGAANGLAELDSSGFVKNTQLPSYVDDVLEYSSLSLFPVVGESGKIYIDTTTNLTYRWSGSTYALVSQSLALGETSSTAYRGDRGKTAYDHSQILSGNPHGTIYGWTEITSKPTTLSGYGITDAIQNQQSAAQTGGLWVSQLIKTSYGITVLHTGNDNPSVAPFINFQDPSFSVSNSISMNGTGGLSVNNYQSGVGTVKTFTISKEGNITALGYYTGTQYKVAGGTSSQYLKADGSLDANTYQPLGTAINVGNIAGQSVNYANVSGNATNWSGYELDFDQAVSVNRLIAFDSSDNTFRVADAPSIKSWLSYGTAANNNTGDFIQNNNSSAQSANMWISGNGTFGGELLLNTNASRLRLQRSTGDNYIDYNNNNGLIFRSISNTDTGAINVLTFTPSGAATFASTVNATQLIINNGYSSNGILINSVGLTTDNYVIFRNETQTCKLGIRNPYGSFGLDFVDPSNNHYKVFHEGNFNPANYLPLAGGIVTGNSWFTYGQNSNSNYSWVNAALTTNSIELVTNVNGSGGHPTLSFHTWGTGGAQLRMSNDNVLHIESAFANSARVAGNSGTDYFNYLDVYSRSPVGIYINGNGVVHDGNIGRYTPYQSNRDFASGTLIKTDIDYSHTEGEPFLLEIVGNSYNMTTPFDIKVQGYIYANQIIAYGGISNGANFPNITVINVDGFLCFWFPRLDYWQGFTVNVNSSYSGNKKNRLVSISDSVKPANATKEIVVTIYQSYHSGNRSFVSKTGDTMSGTLDMQNNTLSNVDTIQHANARIIMHGNLHIDSYNGNAIYNQYYSHNEISNWGTTRNNGYDITGVGILSSSQVIANTFSTTGSTGSFSLVIGNGDAASYDTCTADIKTWNGFGIIGMAGNPWGDGTRTIVFDARGGKIMARGGAEFGGNVTASNFILSSDRTLKTNIQPIIKDYSRLNLVSFNFKDNLDELRFGTIAQDLLSNGYSEFVTGDKEGEYKVKYIDLIIAKLASAELRIKELEDKYGSR